MNLVITISRRFGTGASLIAQELSEKLGVPVYDKAYIEHELDGDSYATEAEVIKELAEHPCIILGRCASEILKDQPNVFNVYVCADKEDRIERIMKKESLPHDEAKEMLEKNDAERAAYYHCAVCYGSGLLSELGCDRLGTDDERNVSKRDFPDFRAGRWQSVVCLCFK